jgi:prevent-host-death family protein
MKNTITATKAKQEFGDVIMRSQITPISVTKNGKPVVVIMSETEYSAMKLQNLRAALIEGELSGDAGELDMQAIKEKARKLMADVQDS